MKFFATGRVHPERAGVLFDEVSGTFGGAASFAIRCDASQLSLALDLPETQSTEEVRLVAQHYANLFVCALGFSNGCGYSAEVIQVFNEAGTADVFGVAPDGKNGSLGFAEQTDTFTRALLLAAENIFFRLALRDYTRALADAEDCASHCYRAVEAVKANFDSWDDMHAALGTSRAAVITHIKEYADPIRHGNWAETKPALGRVRSEMLTLTRDILRGYLDYSKPNVGSNSTSSA